MESSKQYLLSVLSSLSKRSFNGFVDKMWRAKSKLDLEKQSILEARTDLGSGVLENSITYRFDSGRATQQFELIIPFFQPIDLLLAEKEFKIVLREQQNIVRRYKRNLEKRAKEWYWPTDGEFNGANILFVSNLHGVEREVYYEKILPKLLKLVKPALYIDQVGIGTYDSFVDKALEKTELALQNLFSEQEHEVSFVYSNDAIKIENHLVGSYLKSGVLANNLTPCDTVISVVPVSHQEIFKEFEFIINRPFNESQLERFLGKHYRQLFGHHYDRIETQLWLKHPELDVNRKDRRLDIFMRNAVQKDWELIELKGPGKIVSNAHDVPVLASRISKAIAQIKNYERLLKQDSLKRTLATQGIDYFEPELRLVVGGRPDISVAQWRMLKKMNENGLKISTLDDILAEIQMRYSGFSDIILR